MNGVELIAAERQRQIDVEGWSALHDRQWTTDELALAAACYAVPEEVRRAESKSPVKRYWPFGPAWWKPTPHDRIRELVKAGALIAAEIDRLQRISAT